MTATLRWVPRRKTELINLLDRGLLTFIEAQRLHGLSPEELTEWKHALAAYGTPGLRTTRLQIYKRTDAKAAADNVRDARTAGNQAYPP